MQTNRLAEAYIAFSFKQKHNILAEVNLMYTLTLCITNITDIAKRKRREGRAHVQ